jgi:hypothetical protein
MNFPGVLNLSLLRRSHCRAMKFASGQAFLLLADTAHDNTVILLTFPVTAPEPAASAESNCPTHHGLNR